MSYFVLAQGVLGLYTNLEKIKFSYGIYPPPASKEEYDNCALQIELNVSKNFTNTISEDNAIVGKYHYFSAKQKQDFIAYNRTFLFNSKLRLTAQGLLAGKPKIEVNETYFRYIQHRFMNLHSVNYILTDIISLLLLTIGYAPLHCSAFEKDGKTVVIFAPPNTGKTLSTMTLCMEEGANFIAEDLAITDGENIYSVPWTSTFRYYSNINQSVGSKLYNRLINLIPVMELLPINKPEPVTEYVSRENMLSKSKITHAVVLERGQQAIDRDIALDDMLHKVVNLNRYEFNYLKAPILTAYEFFNPDLNIRKAYETERATLKALLENAENFSVIRSEDATQYSKLLLELIH